MKFLTKFIVNQKQELEEQMAIQVSDLENQIEEKNKEVKSLKNNDKTQKERIEQLQAEIKKLKHDNSKKFIRNTINSAES